MIRRMNLAAKRARSLRVQIVHAPSETMSFYGDHPARLRALAALPIALLVAAQHDDLPLPVEDSDRGSDTGELESYEAWSRRPTRATRGALAW